MENCLSETSRNRCSTNDLGNYSALLTILCPVQHAALSTLTSSSHMAYRNDNTHNEANIEFCIVGKERGGDDESKVSKGHFDCQISPFVAPKRLHIIQIYSNKE